MDCPSVFKNLVDIPGVDYHFNSLALFSPINIIEYSFGQSLIVLECNYRICIVKIILLFTCIWDVNWRQERSMQYITADEV